MCVRSCCPVCVSRSLCSSPLAIMASSALAVQQCVSFIALSKTAAAASVVVAVCRWPCRRRVVAPGFVCVVCLRRGPLPSFALRCSRLRSGLFALTPANPTFRFGLSPFNFHLLFQIVFQPVVRLSAVSSGAYCAAMQFNSPCASSQAPSSWMAAAVNVGGSSQYVSAPEASSGPQAGPPTTYAPPEWAYDN